MRDPSPTPSLGISVLGPPAVDGLEELEAPWQIPTPTLFLQSAPLHCPVEDIWTVSGSSGIQVVIKIIIIKKSEET
jgi:hypothetical protein